MNRRSFLKRSLKVSLAGGAALALGRSFWPQTVAARQVSGDLTAQSAMVTLHPSLDPTEVWGFAAGGSPVLRYQQGERLNLRLGNNLAEDVTVHWHGLRVPNEMDGVPRITQDPVQPGETFDYAFDLPDAGTYWYHPHSNSQEQLGRGLAGPLIIEEANPPDVDEDLVLLLQDWRLNRSAQVKNDFYNGHDLAHNGRLGNAVSVNGEIQPSFNLIPGTRVRLRFINASTARLYQPVLPAGWDAWIIALDGQPVPVEPYSPPLLAPGMRADIILDVPAEAEASSISDSVYEPYSLLTFNAVGEARPIRTEPPATLDPNPIAQPSSDAEPLDLVLAGGAMSGMGGMMGGNVWRLNGKGMTELHGSMEPMFVLKQGQSYRMNIVNQTAFAHPMHLHGHTFQLLTQNLGGRFSDTALLLPDAATDIAFVADNPGDWMLHCHILGHQAAGMMALIKVV